MKAIKGNKVYQIDEPQKKDYQDRGFDILDDNDKVIAYGRGKTVPYDTYETLKRENESLKTENETLKAKTAETSEPEKKTGKK